LPFSVIPTGGQRPWLAGVEGPWQASVRIQTIGTITRPLNPLEAIQPAGGPLTNGGNDFGCRTLAIFKGAGFDFPFARRRVPQVRFRNLGLGFSLLPMAHG